MSFSNRASNRSIRFNGGESSIDPNPKPEKSIFCGMSEKGVCISKSLNLGDRVFVDIYRRRNGNGVRFYLHNKGESLTSFRYDSDFSPCYSPLLIYKYYIDKTTHLHHYKDGTMAISESVGLATFWYVGKDKMFVPDMEKMYPASRLLPQPSTQPAIEPQKEKTKLELESGRLKAVASHITDYHRVASLIDKLEDCLTGGSYSEIVVKNKKITKVKFEYFTE